MSRPRCELFVGLVVVGEAAGVDGAEGDDAGAGEGGGVDEVGAAELAGVGEAVGEDEAAFGVGVDDFDGFAGFAVFEGHGDLDVAGLLGFAVGHVFGGADDADDFDFGLELGDGGHGAEHGGAEPAMSYFMSSILSAGLMEMPPVSKVMPLPTSPRTGPE